MNVGSGAHLTAGSGAHPAEDDDPCGIQFLPPFFAYYYMPPLWIDDGLPRVKLRYERDGVDSAAN